MAVLLTLALVLPFQAHSAAELDDWYASWLAAPAESSELLMALMDMRARHPWYFSPAAPDTPHTPAAAAAPSSAPTYAAGVEQWRSLVAAFWPASEVDQMLAIMACESGGDPQADNPTSSAAGLFQIMAFWQTVWPGDYYDPWTNAAVAYQIWLTQGYGAWTCKA